MPSGSGMEGRRSYQGRRAPRVRPPVAAPIRDGKKVRASWCLPRGRLLATAHAAFRIRAVQRPGPAPELGGGPKWAALNPPASSRAPPTSKCLPLHLERMLRRTNSSAPQRLRPRGRSLGLGTSPRPRKNASGFTHPKRSWKALGPDPDDPPSLGWVPGSGPRLLVKLDSLPEGSSGASLAKGFSGMTVS